MIPCFNDYHLEKCNGRIEKNLYRDRFRPPAPAVCGGVERADLRVAGDGPAHRHRQLQVPP